MKWALYVSYDGNGWFLGLESLETVIRLNQEDIGRCVGRSIVFIGLKHECLNFIGTLNRMNKCKNGLFLFHTH